MRNYRYHYRMSTPPSDNKLEDLLRKGMQAVGSAVEKAIGKAQEAKQTIAPQSVAGAAVTIEGQLPAPKIRELLRAAADRLVAQLMPALADRRTIEIGDGVGKSAQLLKEHGARMVVATEIGAGGGQSITDALTRMYMVRAGLGRLPFADASFDFAVANLITTYQGDVSKAVKEIARVLTPGAGLILLDFHPFGPYAKRGAVRVRPTDTGLRGVADLFTVARVAHLKITDVREVFVDESVRAAFATTEEKQAYRALRDEPLIIAYTARKGVPEAAV